MNEFLGENPNASAETVLDEQDLPSSIKNIDLLPSAVSIKKIDDSTLEENKGKSKKREHTTKIRRAMRH